MTSALEIQFGPLLYQALAEPIGLLLKAPEREKVRQKLYQARTAIGDPALAVLQFRVSPFAEGDLVICKGQTLQMARETTDKSEPKQVESIPPKELP